MTQFSAVAESMKVFVSYSRDDVAFADQLALALEDRGFAPFLDRHAIDAAENWRERLGALIRSCDAVVFVLTGSSAGSPVCAWEVEEAGRLGKRIVPIVPQAFAATPPAELAALNWIQFYAEPTVPGSGMFDGLRKLDRALRTDLAWLREQTRLAERALEWRASRSEDLLLRGAPLKEAQDWLGRAPKDAVVPEAVRAYLAASDDAELARSEAARSQVAEREQALKAREDAVKAQARADARFRRLSIIAAGAATVLLASALVGAWFAMARSIEVSRVTATMFADASEGLKRDQFDPTRAALAAVAGGAGANPGPVEALFNPKGYPELANALVRAHSYDRLKQRIDLEKVLPNFSQAEGVLPIGETNRFFVLWRATFEDADDEMHLALFEVGKDLPLEDHALPRSLDISKLGALADADRIAMMPYDGAAFLWGLREKRVVRTFESSGGDPGDIVVDRPGKRLFTADADGKVRLWRLDDPAAPPVEFITGAGRPLQQIALEPANGVAFAAIDDERRVSGWRADKPGAPAVPPQISATRIDSMFWLNGYVYGVAVTPGARAPEEPVRLLPPLPKNTTESTFRAWDTRREPIGRIEQMEMSPNQRWAIVRNGASSRAFALFEMGRGRSRELVDFDRKTLGDQDPPQLASAAFLAGPEAIVTVSQTRWGSDSAPDPEDPSKRLPEIPDYATLDVWSFPEAFVTGLQQEFNDKGELTYTPDFVAVSPSGVVLAVDAQIPEARVLRRGGHTKIPWFDTMQRRDPWGALSADGKYLFGPSRDGTQSLWKLGESKPLMTWKGFPLMRFSPDSQIVFAGEEERITATRIADKQAIGSIPSHKHAEFAVAPDGKHLAVTTRGQEEGIEIWRLGGKAPEHQWRLPASVGSGIEALGYTPDGETIAIALDGDDIVTYRIADGFTQYYSTEREGDVQQFAFSKDGKLMMAVAGESTALVWMLGYPRLPIQRFQADGFVAAFDPSGTHVLIESNRSFIRRALNPLIFATHRERVQRVCDHARALGVGAFSEAQRYLYPVLAQNPDPCGTSR